MPVCLSYCVMCSWPFQLMLRVQRNLADNAFVTTGSLFRAIWSQYTRVRFDTSGLLLCFYGRWHFTEWLYLWMLIPKIFPLSSKRDHGSIPRFHGTTFVDQWFLMTQRFHGTAFVDPVVCDDSVKVVSGLIKPYTVTRSTNGVSWKQGSSRLCVVPLKVDFWGGGLLIDLTCCDGVVSTSLPRMDTHSVQELFIFFLHQEQWQTSAICNCYIGKRGRSLGRVPCVAWSSYVGRDKVVRWKCVVSIIWEFLGLTVTPAQ